ncbi:phosphotransferase [Streptomyces turgidiscabies]|uniref:phosphotransferase n=1 Tax=Streptomyces turgidiscabies TaxID=85558 RepID=UPI0038F64F79
MTGRVGVAPVVARACWALLSTGVAKAGCMKLGSRSAVYRVSLTDGRSVVVKVFSESARRNAITEGRMIAAATGFVRVPAVLGCGPVPGHQATAVVTTDLGPLTLDGAVQAGRIPRAQGLRYLGTLLGRFHEIPSVQGLAVRPFAEHVAWLARRCPRTVMNRLEPALQIMAEPCADLSRMVMGHGDLHGDNIVIPEHGPAAGLLHVVDFAQSGLCVPEFDVAQTMTVTGAVETDDRERVTAAYGRPLDDDLVDASVAFHTVRCWVCTERSGDGVERAQWAQRLNRAVERTAHLFRTPTSLKESSRQ